VDWHECLIVQIVLVVSILSSAPLDVV
jgi:hypothetical protein